MGSKGAGSGLWLLQRSSCDQLECSGHGQSSQMPIRENQLLSNYTNPSETPRSPFLSYQLSSTKSKKGALTRGQGRGCQYHVLHSSGRTRDLGEKSFQLWCLLFPWPDPPSQAPEHILTWSSQSPAVLLVPGYQGGSSHRPWEAEQHFCASSLPLVMMDKGNFPVVTMDKGNFPFEGNFSF